jgi:hypothetical protein
MTKLFILLSVWMFTTWLSSLVLWALFSIFLEEAVEIGQASWNIGFLSGVIAAMTVLKLENTLK